MDFSTLQHIFSPVPVSPGWKDVLTPWSGIVVALIAAAGVFGNAWNNRMMQKEKIAAEKWNAIFKANSDVKLALWQRKHPVAAKALLEFQQAKEAVQYIRTSGYMIRKPIQRVNFEWEDSRDSSRMDAYQHTIARFKERSQNIDALESLRPEFLAIFGMDNSGPFNQMNRIFWKIHGAARELFDRYEHLRAADKSDLRKALERTIWDGEDPEKGDPIADQLEQSIREIEAICRPYMTEPSLPD